MSASKSSGWVRLRSQPRRTPTLRSQHRRRRKRSRLFAHGTCGRSQRLESRTGAALAKAFRFAPVGLGRYRLRNASDLERLRVRQADDADGAAAFPSLPESACSAGASCACRFLLRTRSTRSPCYTCARTHAPTHGSSPLHSLTPPQSHAPPPIASQTRCTALACPCAPPTMDFIRPLFRIRPRACTATRSGLQWRVYDINFAVRK